MKSKFLMRAVVSTFILASIGSSNLIQAEEAPIKIGFMLPYTGTYAALGTAITNGFKQYVNENGVLTK